MITYFVLLEYIFDTQSEKFEAFSRERPKSK